ncbi:MAG: FHA domain-containing protein, partial [Acidimicrobiaceae bacterium]|nr:FHA domain-containing protein [Acidimicrobiaceae bacterium]
MTFEIGLLVEHPDLTERRAVLVDTDPDATVAQLVEACAEAANCVPQRRGDVASQGRWVLARTGEPLDPADKVATLELRWGDCLVGAHTPDRSRSGAEQPTTRRSDTALWTLLAVGGPLGGLAVPLPAGERRVGRADVCDVVLDDPSVSWAHLGLRITGEGVEVRDLGSTNGTLVDGHRLEGARLLAEGSIVEIGATLLTVERGAPSPSSDLRYRDGQLLFNRPPRVAAPRPEPALELPEVPRRPGKGRLPLAASVIPLVIGVVMALAVQQVYFLFFCLMSPAMAVASFISDRRSGRRDYKRNSARFAEAVDRLEADAAAAHTEVLMARRRAAPSPTQLVERARLLAPQLWERRPDDTDFLALRVGVADQPSWVSWPVPPETGSVTTDSDVEDEAAARLAALRRRHDQDLDTPVVVPMNDVVLGVAGPVEERERLARALLVQAVTLHSPRDLAVVALVPAERKHCWRWLAWLPHLRAFDDSVAVASDEDEMAALLRSLASLVSERKTSQQGALGGTRWSPRVLLFVAGDVAVPRALLADVLADGPAVGVTGLMLAGSATSLPGESGAVVDLNRGDNDRAELVTTKSGQRLAPVIVDGVPPEIAEEVALSLAPVRDVTTVGRGGDLPRRTLLVDLLGLVPPVSPVSLLERWQRAADDLAAVIGGGPAGPFEIDLRRDGPHALVAGTTGAGKSELLQTLVASLAATHRPDRVTFVLVDYKGGAAFKDCVRLPHVVGFFTDLDGHLARRALTSLNAELRRREHLLAAAGAKDLIEMEHRRPDRAPASLVVVIDEFAFLKREVPEFVDGVVDVAQRGRSLGVHLVLATQQPSGVVDDKIRANTNLRVALRVAGESDSSDVIGRREAAHIPRSLPGRAYVRTGHTQTDPVQTAYVGAVHAEAHPVPEVSARPMPWSAEDAAARSGAVATGQTVG